MINIKDIRTNCEINFILKNIGIIQYKLNRPKLLKGLSNLNISPHIKIVIVTDKISKLDKIFIDDVLYSLNIIHSQVKVIQPEQLTTSTDKLTCPYWLIGVKTKKLSNSLTLYTSHISKLMNNSREKRLFWKKLCNYYTYFK
ncbi:DNA polymerase III subunit psi [Candidatus Pantoea edessiphila]|uniref:DNA polymerase III subunit psi n=1 Tax=Candidatus Pantoea edessiphila TaxID=2044610 RepID=UPI001319ED09|nr:DNA polymerase III subunit psi [Candidatus Pantoea edessiphila]